MGLGDVYKRQVGCVWVFGNFFIWPAERAQKDFLLLASLLPFLGLPVTAVFNLLPGFALRYAATPFLVMPAPFLVALKFPDLTEVLIGVSFLLAMKKSD